MRRRQELTNAQWKLVEPHLPAGRARGGRWRDHRTVLNGILWALKTGAKWREAPDRYGPRRTVYDRFRRWSRDGTIDRLLKVLQLKLDEQGLIATDLWCVDAPIVRAGRSAAGGKKRRPDLPREPADHALGKSRGGYGTKVHLVTDAAGVPLAAVVLAGQRHESTQFEAVPGKVRLPRRRGRPRTRPAAVAGDKGYSYARIRRYPCRRGARAVIPARNDQRANSRFDREAYRRRSAVERCVGWLRESRRAAHRVEKLAAGYPAVVHLAMLRRYLRLLAPSDRA
ncbi:IS5 family transposase [Alienimonas sp. DA493]|uniref:IS5 family transposase n=1 Tax=Alienimonas sp. DA493 TaxID=3373605 RepID=UPI003754CFB6